MHVYMHTYADIRFPPHKPLIPPSGGTRQLAARAPAPHGARKQHSACKCTRNAASRIETGGNSG